MYIVKLSDGAADCHVLVPSLVDGDLLVTREVALDLALEAAWEAEYFDKEVGAAYQREVVNPDVRIGVWFDDVRIRHTCHEWCLIYSGIVTKPVILSQSEY